MITESTLCACGHTFEAHAPRHTNPGYHYCLGGFTSIVTGHCQCVQFCAAQQPRKTPDFSQEISAAVLKCKAENAARDLEESNIYFSVNISRLSNKQEFVQAVARALREEVYDDQSSEGKARDLWDSLVESKHIYPINPKD